MFYLNSILLLDFIFWFIFFKLFQKIKGIQEKNNIFLARIDEHLDAFFLLF